MMPNETGSEQGRRRPTKLRLECPCGEWIVGDSEGELVDLARIHLESAHPGRNYSDEEILFMAF